MKVQLKFFVFALSLLLVGCYKEESIEENLPDELILEIDQTHEEVTSAPILTVEFIQIDGDRAVEVLLNNEVITEEETAFGQAFLTDQKNSRSESLYVYGDKDSAIRGGFNYVVTDEAAVINYDEIVSLDNEPPDLVTQEMQTFNDNYATYTDLAFKPYQEVEGEIITKLELLGVEEAGLEIVYALDKDTMNDHLTKNEAYNRKYNDEVDLDNTAFGEEDEAYLLQFRQKLHDLPVVNFMWQSGSREKDDITETIITAIYNKNGINHLSVQEYYTVISSGNEQELINQSEALAEVKDYYQDSIITTSVVIDQAGLYYIGLTDGDQRKLVPAWIFRTRAEREATEEHEAFDDYQFFVIHAITGEIITQ